LSRLRTRIT